MSSLQPINGVLKTIPFLLEPLAQASEATSFRYKFTYVLSCKAAIAKSTANFVLGALHATLFKRFPCIRVISHFARGGKLFVVSVPLTIFTLNRALRFYRATRIS